MERLRRAARFYEKGLARLDGEWAGHGDGGARYLDPAHLYAQDLDIFGPGSLFELVCTARTHIGEDTLARWLSPAAPEVVRARQQRSRNSASPSICGRTSPCWPKTPAPAWTRSGSRAGARRSRCAYGARWRVRRSPRWAAGFVARIHFVRRRPDRPAGWPARCSAISSCRR